MSQDRWPHITTSVSGISAEDWDLFKKTARKRGLSYREAMERAVAELIADIRSGREIYWYPCRKAASRPIKIHNDTLEDIRSLVENDKIGYRQNVIFLTAMIRWAENPKVSSKPGASKP